MALWYGICLSLFRIHIMNQEHLPITILASLMVLLAVPTVLNITIIYLHLIATDNGFVVVRNNKVILSFY